jgi:hypothetical protein
MVNRDEEHLRLLSILQYVMGGIIAFFSCFGLIYVLLGVFFALMPAQAFGPGQGQPPPPKFIGLMFAVIGGGFLVLGWALAALLIVAGRSLARRQRWVLCLVAAGIQCLWMPFGTALGVFTIIVLMRPSVQAMFGRPAATP